MHSVKRERIEAEYETKKIVEGLNKGGITSASDNNGKVYVFELCHQRLINIVWKLMTKIAKD